VFIVLSNSDPFFPQPLFNPINLLFSLTTEILN
jgi:hypothetical protein